MVEKGGTAKKKRNYDVVVIGAGSSGFSAAFAAKDSGASVAIVEEEKLGGECPNWACVPSKALLRAGKAYAEMQHASQFGVHAQRVSHNFKEIMAYQKEVVRSITGGGERGDRYLKTAGEQGIDVYFGKASFTGSHSVSIKGHSAATLQAKSFVVATGTVSFVPPIKGLEGTPFWGFRDVMENRKQPKSLIVIGGGPVGCELATFFATFGTRVTVIQGAPAILNREDTDISAAAKKAMEETGIDVRVNAKVVAVKYKEGRRGDFNVDIEGRDSVSAEKLLVATGKRPNLDGLDAEKLKIKLTDRGFVKVSSKQQTNIKHVFSAGDVIGGYQFTHTAHVTGHVAGLNAAAIAKKRKKLETVDLDVVPRATFIHPEVASVGMTEAEAKKKLGKILVGSWHVESLGRAATDAAPPGLMKVVADAKTGKIVGGHMIGERAGEVVHEVALAIYLDAKMEDLAGMIHAYPTYSEAVTAAASLAKVK